MKRVFVKLSMILLAGCFFWSAAVIASSQAVAPCAAESTAEQSSTTDKIQQSACDYLWRQQRVDGSWRSTKYGILSSGQAYTPFVLYTLLRCDDNPSSDAIEKALVFMRSNIRSGAIGLADPDVIEYPVYSTAYALMCFKVVGAPEDKELIREMQRYLIAEQFTEQRGFNPSHCAYGGWGFGGKHRPGQTGHMDLAHTRRALQALAMHPRNVETLSEVQRKAETFLKMVQKHPDDKREQPLPKSHGHSSSEKIGFDGGFYFSPVVSRANKGRINDDASPFWNSYATATCEGLLALVAANVSRSDDRVMRAIAWLNEHRQLDFPAGIPEFYEGENWREAVTFYHLSVRGEVARLLNEQKTVRTKIAAILSPHQKPDGSFINQKSNLMKEDDPILSTSLAVIALRKAD